MGNVRELEYLRQLHIKYAHYFKQYFGFSEKEIADYMGIRKSKLSNLIADRIKLSLELEYKLREAFEHFDIVNKTKDFKETEDQKSTRALWQKLKLDNRVFSAIIILTMANAIFLKPINRNFLQYICYLSVGNKKIVNFFKAKLEFYLSFAFSFFKQKLNQIILKPNQSLGFFYYCS